MHCVLILHTTSGKRSSLSIETADPALLASRLKEQLDQKNSPIKVGDIALCEVVSHDGVQIETDDGLTVLTKAVAALH